MNNMNKIFYQILYGAIAIVVASVIVISLTNTSKNVGGIDVNTLTLFNSTSTAVSGQSVVLNGNGGRKYAILSNVGANTATLAFVSTATTTAGNFSIVLPANTTYTINLYNLYRGQILASSTGGTNINSLEAYQ